ncbi:NAD(P)-binding domain-containing protein [Paenibacillus lactis]|uniref:NAD(P)-binding domain-containing protein n=1 Tax=Paenibacillus lactis TaxID=228574 RepID=UPI001BCF5E97|nr:NAD(P)-binding domain-containing protein [Paenibacillus lactis]
MAPVLASIVIGGGQAGITSGYYLKKNGLKFLILEAGEHAAGSWPHYYDSLKLFSPVRLSSLPGMRISGAATHYPSQNEVIQYFPIGALGTEGKPIQTAGISLTAPGLYYVGLEGQRSFTSATLRGGVGPDEKYVVSKLMRYLKIRNHL